MKQRDDTIFIYPTDTVWGIGASIYSEEAYKKIAKIKKTTTEKPLSIMFTNIETLFLSFNFPQEMSLKWLKKFFTLESTLGIPLALSRIEIPRWVTGKSHLVSVRCLEFDLFKKNDLLRDGPFFTTSLNLSGEKPIVSLEEARNFLEKYASDAEFLNDVTLKKTPHLSGSPSTIIFFQGDFFEIHRPGEKLEEIKKHLALTGFRIH